MIDNKKIYVIIPARGGSKRLLRKNIYPVLEKPMISYAISESLKSKYIDNVFVSSEDSEILSVAKDFGAIPIIRSRENANDTAFKQHAIIECLETLSKNDKTPDIVISLQANSPEILVKDLDAAIEKFVEFERDELMSFNSDLIQNAAFRIMRYNYCFQQSLSTKCGCFITNYIDVHTIEDVTKVEKIISQRSEK